MVDNISFQAPADGISPLPPLSLDPNAETSFFKNPRSNYTPNPNVNVSISGGEDNRVPIRVDEGYDSVVDLRIQNADGSVGYCTGAIQNIEGYTHDGTIVTTAAHCIRDDTISITAYGDYETQEGYYDRFQLQDGEAYVHPDFASTNPRAFTEGVADDATTDAAVIHFDQLPPDGVIPSTFLPIDIAEFNENMADLGSDGVRGMTVNATGFSADQVGLTVDPGCSIYQGDSQELITTCDGAQRFKWRP